jgi:hypothetical protein
VGLQITKGKGIHIASRSLLAEGGMLHRVSQQAKPAEGDLMAGLPRGAFMFAGGGIMSKEGSKPLMRFSMQMMKSYPGGASLTDEQIERLIDLSIKSLERVKSMSMSFGVGDLSQSLYSNMAFAMEVDDARAYMKEYRASMEEMLKIGKETGHPFLAYDVQDVTIGDKPALKVTIDMSAANMMGAAPEEQAEKMMEMMFGPGGKLSVFLAAADDDTVVGVYVSRARLNKLLKAAQQGQVTLSQTPSVKATTELLIPGAQFVGVWSPAGTVGFASQFMKAVDPQTASRIPTFPQTSPVGFALKAERGLVDTDLVVPMDVLKATAGLVLQVLAPPQED